MKGVIFIVLCLALICSFTYGARDHLRFIDLPAGNNTNATVADYLQSHYPKFASLLKQYNSGAWNQIVNASGSTYFTVFAPSDASINHSKIVDITKDLAYHVHPGDFASGNFRNYTTLYTLFIESELANHSQVLSFTIPNNTIIINKNILITAPDVVCPNGVIHGISGPINLPSQSVLQVLANNKNYSTLVKLASRVNVTLNLNYITVLAPTNSAFDRLFATNPLLENYLLNTNLNSTFANIRAILNLHVVTQSFYPSYLSYGNSTFSTVSGTTLDVYRDANQTIRVIDPSGVTASYIVDPNNLAGNGVVHGIDSVLVPQGFGLSVVEVLAALNISTFVNQVNKNNVSYLLTDNVPRTYFIPTEHAISGQSLNASQILYHISSVINVAFTNTVVDSLLNLTSLGGNFQQLYATSNRSVVNNQTVTINRINGVNVGQGYMTNDRSVVYLIDTALSLPAATLPTLSANFSDFYSLLSEKLGDNQTFPINEPKTSIFAPTDEALASLPLGYVGYLRLNTAQAKPVAQSVINNHILNNNLYYQVRDGHVTTADRNNLTITTSTGRNRPLINQYIPVHEEPILTSVGAIHAIDGVILPPHVAFNADQVLQGLGNHYTDEIDTGSYSIFLEHAATTGLLDLLQSPHDNFTIFAPTNDAWGAASEKWGNDNHSDIDRLKEVLNYHIVYDVNIENLVLHSVFFPGPVINHNITLSVTKGGINQTAEITLDQGRNSYSSNVKPGVSTTTSYGQRIYGIDRVLGVGVAKSGKSGLPTWAWVVIVVGGILVGLLILAIVGVAIWYLLIRPNRDGYRKIN